MLFMNTSVSVHGSWLSSLMLNSICFFHSKDGDNWRLRKKGEAKLSGCAHAVRVVSVLK